MATRSYTMLSTMMTTKLMMEAVTDVAICGVMYSLSGSRPSSSRSCDRSFAEKVKNTARRYMMMATTDARISRIWTTEDIYLLYTSNIIYTIIYTIICSE